MAVNKLKAIIILSATAIQGLRGMDESNIKTLSDLQRQDQSGIAAASFLQQVGLNLAVPKQTIVPQEPGFWRTLGENTAQSYAQGVGQGMGQVTAQAAAPLAEEVGNDVLHVYRSSKNAVSDGFNWVKEKFTAQYATATGYGARFPLHQAVVNNNLAAVTRRLQHHPTEINQLDGDGYTPLMVAIMMGHQALVKSLLHELPDLELVNNNGDTALDIARQCNSFDLVKQIREHQKKQKETVDRHRTRSGEDLNEEETQEPQLKRRRIEQKQETTPTIHPLVPVMWLGLKLLTH